MLKCFLFYDYKNRLFAGKASVTILCNSCRLTFVTLTSFAALVILALEIEQNGVYHAPKSGSQSPCLSNSPFSRKKLPSMETVVLIFSDCDFTRRCRPADLFFLLIFSKTLEFINYAHNTDLPTNKLKLC